MLLFDEISVYILMIVWDKLCPDVWRNFPIFLFIKTSTFIKCWGNLPLASNNWLIFRVGQLIVDVFTCMITFPFVLPIKNQSYIQNNMNLYNGWTTQNKVRRNQKILITWTKKREGFDGISGLFIYLFCLYCSLSTPSEIVQRGTKEKFVLKWDKE